MGGRRRGWSDITVTDQFCGAGGSSIGAQAAGLRLRMALNHWQLAVDTHNTNFPNADHDCCDISAADPRRYPSTDILITSPECTTHSPAGGNRRNQSGQRDIFMPRSDDPTAERSRATMRDVPRFAEYHMYRRIIVENVVEVTRWPLFHHWLQEMQLLGYQWKLVSHNSMFSWPTPQSRDRLYIIFWRQGDKAPDMAITPQAPCFRCEKVINGVQTWKAGAIKRAVGGQPVGKYRTQYVYTCSTCKGEVTPFYYAALNAIDFSLEATRIGDRESLGKPALASRTMERIKYGLETYGNRHLLIRTNMTSGTECRVRGLEQPHFGQTASWLDAMFAPYIVGAANTGHSHGRRVMGLDESLTTVHAGGGNHALVQPGFAFNVGGRDSSAPLDRAMPTQETREKFALCFLTSLRGGGGEHGTRPGWRVGMDQPVGTVTADGNHYALIGPGFAPFVATNRENNLARGLDDALTPMNTGQHHMLIQGAAQISMRDADGMRVAGLDEEFRTQGTKQQQALIQRAPFLATVAYDQQAQGSWARGADQPIPTMRAGDAHAVVQPGKKLRVEDCYFRMLQPHEIGRAMAFPDTYVVLGNKRERVKQFGNAVTPPVMATLISRQVQAMTGERSE